MAVTCWRRVCTQGDDQNSNEYQEEREDKMSNSGKASTTNAGVGRIYKRYETPEHVLVFTSFYW